MIVQHFVSNLDKRSLILCFSLKALSILGILSNFFNNIFPNSSQLLFPKILSEGQKAALFYLRQCCNQRCGILIFTFIADAFILLAMVKSFIKIVKDFFHTAVIVYFVVYQSQIQMTDIPMPPSASAVR